MSKRKKNKNNEQHSTREDLEDMSGKGTWKEKRKARRHSEKNNLKDMISSDGDFDENELDMYMNNIDW